MKKLLLTIALSYSLLAEFKTITADSLIKMQKQGIPVIDIRTPQEWKDRGIIKGAHKIMRPLHSRNTHKSLVLGKVCKYKFEGLTR